MLVCGRLAQVYTSQDHENVRLNQRNPNMKPLENNWHSNGHQRKEHQGDHLARKHVGVETNCQREQSCRMAEDLDRYHQRGQPPYWSHEVLEISQTVGAQSVKVIVKPRQ